MDLHFTKMKEKTSDLLQAITISLFLGIMIGGLLFSKMIEITGVDEEKYCNCEEIKTEYNDVKDYCVNNSASCYSILNCQNQHDKIYLCNAK